MIIPKSYNLNRKDLDEVIELLEGNESNKEKWIDEFCKWRDYYDKQLQIYELTKEWLTKYGRDHGWDICNIDDFGSTPEEILQDQVSYYLSYAPFQWNAEENKVEINKYDYSTVLDQDMKEELLVYLNKNIEL